MTLAPLRPFRPLPKPTIRTLRVRSSSSGWQLLVDDAELPAWTVSTKRKAVRSARLAACDLGCRLVVETARGRIQDTLDFSEAA